MTEEWRPAPVEGYEVSSLGRLRKHTRTGLRIIECRLWGRYVVASMYPPGCARAVTVRLHRMVCEVFHGPPPSPRHQAAHNDGNRLNCRADNLRWALPVENNADKVAHGTVQRGERANNARLTEDAVRAIRRARDKGAKYTDLAARFGISWQQVGFICRRQAWGHVPD